MAESTKSDNEPKKEFVGGTREARHLCVLVHGLWGNPGHLDNVARSLRRQHAHDKLWICMPKSNTGNNTYDGIELGGERVCAEIEEELEHVKTIGGAFTQISVIGYSLGGLIARYAIGLLHARGKLDGLECKNFVTFATPHLGVRAPLKGWHSHLWNVIGARTLSHTGHQLFTIDSFRDSKKPLLLLMTDPKSIFMNGLRRFKRHSLYTNIVHDRTAVYYTTSISKTDPFANLSAVNVNYLPGYADVILDPDEPVDSQPRSPVRQTFRERSAGWLRSAPFKLGVVLMMPVGITTFLGYSVVQTFMSARRIRLHESGKGGVRLEDYRLPLWIREVEMAYEELNSSQAPEYADVSEAGTRAVTPRSPEKTVKFPTLALSKHQFEMIDSLDSLGWRKFRVWIHLSNHSHAAIIRRMERDAFEEGKLVLKHFSTEEFLA